MKITIKSSTNEVNELDTAIEATTGNTSDLITALEDKIDELGGTYTADMVTV